MLRRGSKLITEQVREEQERMKKPRCNNCTRPLNGAQSCMRCSVTNIAVPQASSPQVAKLQTPPGRQVRVCRVPFFVCFIYIYSLKT